MTPLRSRMTEDMQLHGYSPSTQEVYLGSIARLAKHYHKSPDLISEEELRQYFLDLTHTQKVSRSTATVALCAIKFLAQSRSDARTEAAEAAGGPEQGGGQLHPGLPRDQSVRQFCRLYHTPLFHTRSFAGVTNL